MPRPLFISHGAPDVLIKDTPAHRAMQMLGERPTPRAYVVISAHWQSGDLQITASDTPDTIHDFRGFGEKLERFQYPVAGSAEIAGHIATLLNRQGLPVRLNQRRGLDHGSWVPMALVRPQADAPVLQLSLPRQNDSDSVVLGRALTALIDRDIQIIGSGALTHSLADSLPLAETAPVANFAEEFREAVLPALETGDIDAALAWRSVPHAQRNHPTPEHYRPLLVAMAAGGRPGQCLHTSWSRSALAMDIWEF
ncbi:class III extradiol ring-cleavage dioxygenase [Maricaulis sp.]|uniref:DODA-type extradiol aromatic ring-opening family dioxygenase n=1 Tax=unclassified Maricaulis TaxID=2632371 RepID=UPI001B12EC84|nr:class III extradiol ring-cleavage dioxygenase [Maricaulis sp.]MBO6796286.1 dioxygenase [Maricaulis sp.]